MTEIQEVPRTKRARKKGKIPTARQLEIRKRDAQVCDLHIQGQTFDQIAATMGYASSSGVTKAWQRGMGRMFREPLEAMVGTSDARLQAMYRDAYNTWSRAISEGKEEVALKALEFMRKTDESRRRLWGMDAPTRTEISGSVPSVVVFHQSLQFPGGVVGDPPEVIDG